MKKLNKIKGELGEKQAVNFLKKSKYNILETNYTNKLGEIDIIALKNKTIVFVEVKAREDCSYGRPCEAVTVHKQNKIKTVASYYLMTKGWSQEFARFDVIEILDGNINHIENAF